MWSVVYLIFDKITTCIFLITRQVWYHLWVIIGHSVVSLIYNSYINTNKYKMTYSNKWTSVMQLVILFVLLTHTNAQIVDWFAVPTIRAGKIVYMQDKSTQLSLSLLPLTPHPLLPTKLQNISTILQVLLYQIYKLDSVWSVTRVGWLILFLSMFLVSQ